VEARLEMFDRDANGAASRMPYPMFVSRLKSQPAILGVGAVEQHGPDLPLSTDSLIVDSLCDSLAERLPAVKLPTLAYGAPSRPRYGGGDLFPVPSLSLPTLYSVVEQLVAGMVKAGASQVVVVSWHWENAQILWDAVRAGLEGTSGRAVIFDSPADFLSSALRDQLFPEGFPGWASDHAGRLEAAIMRHLADIRPSGKGMRAPHVTGPFDVLPTPSELVPADGVFYDPGDPSAELGGACLTAIAEALIVTARERTGAPR
jgi:creatinine amidohydrolase